MRSTCWLTLLAATAVSAIAPRYAEPEPQLTPTRTAKRASSGFVSTSGTDFELDGKPFPFIGTNAYWLPTLNSEKDINNTLHSIAAKGIKVVRTWGFNDVTTIPKQGIWFQAFQNGHFTVNTGANGLQRLDTVIELAEAAGLKVLLTLTNNWNPQPLTDGVRNPPFDGIPTRRSTEEEMELRKRGLLSGEWEDFEKRDVTAGTNNTLPRNFLSNDYGGADFYVRALGGSKKKFHDVFFEDQTIINAFLNYTDQVVKRYVNSKSLLAWELANDPRCASSLGTQPSCNTNTITRWHAQVAAHIASIDKNHLITSGTQGFTCMVSTCPPKLFATQTPSPPQVSPAPGKKRAPVVTLEKVLKNRAERRKINKRKAEAERRSLGLDNGGMKIRGRWSSGETMHKRQANPAGSAMDGTFGVDSQDIAAIPEIGFSTFQLFPDQNEYEPFDPSLSNADNLKQEGVEWIKFQGSLAKQAGKPALLTAFGLVTQDNAPFFVPFNSTTEPFNKTSTSHKRQSQASFGVTAAQQSSAYSAWLNAASSAGVAGVNQYQWTQSGVSTAVGSTVQPNSDTTGETPNQDSTGSTPNDGYGISPTGSDGVIPILSGATSVFGGI